jgi:hypothetical protein
MPQDLLDNIAPTIAALWCPPLDKGGNLDRAATTRACQRVKRSG